MRQSGSHVVVVEGLGDSNVGRCCDATAWQTERSYMDDLRLPWFVVKKCKHLAKPVR